MKVRALPFLTAIASLSFACAAERKEAAAPASTPSQPAPAYAQAPSAAAASAPAGTPPSMPSPAPPPKTELPKLAQPSEPAADKGGRAAALGQARSELDASQRELDVAGSDCRNACRALGSMDRAAGHLCGLVESDEDRLRCTDAKSRVYSARDRVRSTCGTCPDVSVERNAPIPSR